MPQVETQTDGNGAVGMVPTEPAAIAVAQCRAWLVWAAAQVDACLASDKLAVAELLASLHELMDSARPQSAPPSASDNDGADRKMSAVIVAAQSHDRVMQALTHVSESLRMLQEHMGDVRCAESAESWRMLRAKQLRAFSMPEERVLFAGLVAEKDEWHEPAVNPEETVELFVGGDGLFES